MTYAHKEELRIKRQSRDRFNNVRGFLNVLLASTTLSLVILSIDFLVKSFI